MATIRSMRLQRIPRALRGLLPVVLLAVFLLPALPSQAALTCGDIPDLTTVFLQKHVRFHGLTPDIRDRAIDNYVRRIDPQRVLFLQEDVEKLRQELRLLFAETRNGDCSRLRDLHRDLVARHQEAEGFVRGFVGAEDYALDESVELILDPDERPYATTKDERDERLRTLVHFQISNYLAADTELPEAKERLVHRYELATRRVREQERDDLYAQFLDSMASALDPHSGYLSADVLEDFQIQMQLSLEGIGVALTERDGYAVVEQIIPGGAAAQLDVLRPKDRIIAVAETGEKPVDVIDMALRDVVRLIRGRKGTEVQLTVLRQGEKAERFTVAIERDTIDLEQQAAKLRFEERQVGERTLKLAVLELPAFYGETRDPSKRLGSRDVARLLTKVREEKADGLLLDLSRNGGGLLDDAVRISGFFIREGGVVAVKEGDGPRRVLDDPHDGILYDGPMVVLTSRVSASASEILAGALKDYRRAVIVGDDHTFGKGTVQSVVPWRPGAGAIKVTTALFFRPGGISTQHSGVATDVVLPSLFATEDFGERTQRYSLPPDSTQPFLSAKANDAESGTHWTPIESEVVAELSRRSAARIADDPFFGKIREQLAERAADDGVVRLAELIAEREEARTASTGAGSPGEDTAAMASPGGDEDDEEPSPHVEEALRVLADLVQLIS
jgi:carboxyl-terminal processing protease